MVIWQINSCNFGSTGKIMLQISNLVENMGHKTFVAVPKSRANMVAKRNNQIFIGNRFLRNLHIISSRFFGYDGLFTYFSTRELLKEIEKNRSIILHLHNLHGGYINFSLLFKYIKKYNIRVIWTLHDCWTFTGHCPHFEMIGCDKWRTGCHHCLQYKEYPKSYVDRSKVMYRLKKKWFTGVKNMILVTPSQWLADLVKQSFLKEYPVQVINNGIDLNVFKPTESDFKRKYNCENKFIVLGVAFGWGKGKGLDVFIELSKRLNERYQIVLVGTSDSTDKQLPSNIISIHRTQNQKELAEIYTVADLFVNPTREENFPTVNMESLACGTPVLTFKTGGSPEIIDETCGAVVEKDDIDALEKEIRRICQDRPFSKEACIKRANNFDMNDKFAEYVELYQTYKQEEK